MSNRIIIPGAKDYTPLSPPQFVNKLSWMDIGNKDEDQRRKFVQEVHKFYKACIRYGLHLASETIIEDGNPMVAKGKIDAIAKKFDL